MAWVPGVFVHCYLPSYQSCLSCAYTNRFTNKSSYEYWWLFCFYCYILEWTDFTEQRPHTLKNFEQNSTTVYPAFSCMSLRLISHDLSWLVLETCVLTIRFSYNCFESGISHLGFSSCVQGFTHGKFHYCGFMADLCDQSCCNPW